MLKTKRKIEEWLDQYKITNYELIPDEEYGYVVNVNESVNLCENNLNKIKVKFNKVNGHFFCFSNKLTSLKGSPEEINGDFNCYNNLLVDLKYGTKNGIKDYVCSCNKLNSLKYSPKIINGNLFLHRNQLNILALLELNLEKVKFIDLNFNPDLGELQNIEDVNELKKILTIYQEKADLMNILKVTDKSVEKLNNLLNIDNKINKI